MKVDINKLYDDFKNGNKINLNNLRKILQDNKDTDFGKKYNFTEICSNNNPYIIEDFRQKVPLSSYDDYKNAGSTCVYDKYLTVRTSGTTGEAKKFLISKESLTRYSSYAFLMPFHLSGIEPKNLLHVSLFHNKGKETIFSDATHRFLREEKLIDCNDFLGGEECMFCDEKTNIPYLKLWIALANENLTAVMSTFLYDILLLMNYLEKNWEILLNDIEHGCFSENIPDSMKETLLSMKVSPERLKFLRSEFQKGFDENTVKRIWKNLKFVYGIGGQLYNAYDNALKNYIGDIPIYYYIYAQSECMSAIATKFNDSSYTLFPQSAFFEFWDMSENAFYLPENVIIGKRYQLVVTTFSGLYRYKTRDIVEITGFNEQCPVLKVCDRVQHLLNIDGEKIDEATINLVLERLISSLNLKLRTYYVGIDCRTVPSRYVLVLDIQKINLGLKAGDIAQEFDKILQEISWDYMDLRSLNLIGEPECKFVKGSVIASMQTGHTKPGIIMSNDKIKKILDL